MNKKPRKRQWQKRQEEDILETSRRILDTIGNATGNE